MTTRTRFTRRTLLTASAGMAGILATGRAPAFAQTAPKKLVFAHINASPESMLMAIIPPFRTLANSASGVFLTVPCCVAKNSSPDCRQVTSSRLASVFDWMRMSAIPPDLRRLIPRQSPHLLHQRPGMQRHR